MLPKLAATKCYYPMASVPDKKTPQQLALISTLADKLSNKMKGCMGIEVERGRLSHQDGPTSMMPQPCGVGKFALLLPRSCSVYTS